MYVAGDVGAFQPSHPVELREGTVIVVRTVGQEFSLRLLPQGFGIHKEKDALHPSVFQQPVGCGDGCEGFARPGGHLYQRFWSAFRKGLIKILDCCDLTLAEACGIKRREMLQIVANRIRLGKERLQGLRAMEREDPARAVFFICVIREAGQLAGGLVGKADAVIGFNIFEGAVGVATGLLFNGGNILSQVVLFGFNHADRLSFHKKGIVHRPCAGGILPHGNTEGCHGIHFSQILNDPAGLLQPGVDLFSSLFFRGHGFHLLSMVLQTVQDER